MVEDLLALHGEKTCLMGHLSSADVRRVNIQRFQYDTVKITKNIVNLRRKDNIF